LKILTPKPVCKEHTTTKPTPQNTTPVPATPRKRKSANKETEPSSKKPRLSQGKSPSVTKDPALSKSKPGTQSTKPRSRRSKRQQEKKELAAGTSTGRDRENPVTILDSSPETKDTPDNTTTPGEDDLVKDGYSKPKGSARRSVLHSEWPAGEEHEGDEDDEDHDEDPTNDVSLSEDSGEDPGLLAADTKDSQDQDTNIGNSKKESEEDAQLRDIQETHALNLAIEAEEQRQIEEQQKKKQQQSEEQPQSDVSKYFVDDDDLPVDSSDENPVTKDSTVEDPKDKSLTGEDPKDENPSPVLAGEDPKDRNPSPVLAEEDPKNSKTSSGDSGSSTKDQDLVGKDSQDKILGDKSDSKDSNRRSKLDVVYLVQSKWLKYDTSF